MGWADYFALAVIQGIVTFGAAYLAVYLMEKEKNLATREDIQEVTKGSASADDEDRQEESLKLLFDYSKDAFKEDREIFRDLENKASKYLTVFTALLAAAGFFANWLGMKVLPPKDCLEIALLGNGLMLIVIIFATWLLIFLVLKVGDFEELPLDQSTIDFFLQKPIQQIYKGGANGLKEGMEKNAKTRMMKAKLLKWGYRLIILTWLLLVVFHIKLTDAF